MKAQSGIRDVAVDRLKCDGTRAKTRFRLSAERTSPRKSAPGGGVQSTTGSRVMRISGSNAGYTMFQGSAKGTGYPLHSSVSPSLPLPCAITFQLDSTMSLTSVLDGVGGQRHASAALPPGERQLYPLCMRLGGPLGLSGRARKILPRPGFQLCINMLRMCFV